MGDHGLAGLTSPVTQRLGNVVVDRPLTIREGRASNVGGVLTETSGGKPDLDYCFPVVVVTGMIFFQSAVSAALARSQQARTSEDVVW